MDPKSLVNMHYEDSLTILVVPIDVPEGCTNRPKFLEENTESFSIKKHGEMAKLMNDYCEQENLDKKKTEFYCVVRSLGLEKILIEECQTPYELELENYDYIWVKK